MFSLSQSNVIRSHKLSCDSARSCELKVATTNHAHSSVILSASTPEKVASTDARKLFLQTANPPRIPDLDDPHFRCVLLRKLWSNVVAVKKMKLIWFVVFVGLAASVVQATENESDQYSNSTRIVNRRKRYLIFRDISRGFVSVVTGGVKFWSLLNFIYSIGSCER